MIWGELSLTPTKSGPERDLAMLKGRYTNTESSGVVSTQDLGV